jgi:hypothetical protein
MNIASDQTKVICANILLTTADGFQRIKKSKVAWLNFGMFIMHSTCLVHKEVYVFYDQKYRIAMDFDFFLRIKKNGFVIQRVDQTIVYMRTMGESNNITKMHNEEIVVIKAHLTGIRGLVSYFYKKLNILRWKYFYKSTFGIIPDYAPEIHPPPRISLGYR